MKKAFIVIFVLLLVACNQSTYREYHADYPYYQTFEDMTKKADSIFEGEVLSSAVYAINPSKSDDFMKLLHDNEKPENDDFVYTVYEIKVLTVYKGTLELNATIRIKVLGGNVGNDVYTDLKDVSFEHGYEFLFLTASFSNEFMPWSLINPEQGYYQIIEDIYIKNSQNSVEIDMEVLTTLES